ncbi:MAG TPA: hypothetical protein VFB23_08890 [Candidatus Acidoferrales bacterium]|nr:hypothetical protein [Candidatus Acidoferrales bacterium]
MAKFEKGNQYAKNRNRVNELLANRLVERIQKEGDKMSAEELTKAANTIQRLKSRGKYRKKGTGAVPTQERGEGRLDAWEKLFIEARNAMREGRYDEWEKSRPWTDEEIRCYEAVHRPRLQEIERAQRGGR